MDLAGKRVLITGGAVRVGAALAEGFARSGAKISIHYRRSAEEAERLLCTLPGEGHDCIAANFADPEEAQTLIARTGHCIDILVNNASYYVRDAADAAEITVNDYSAGTMPMDSCSCLAVSFRSLGAII